MKAPAIPIAVAVAVVVGVAVLLSSLTRAAAGPATTRADRTVEELAGEVAPRTVRIFGLRGSGGPAGGPSTGALVSGGRFALAVTVGAAAGRQVTVVLPGNVQIVGTVRFFDPDTRVAVVELERPAPRGGLAISGAPMGIGEPVMASGYPWAPGGAVGRGRGAGEGTVRGDDGPSVGLGVVARVLRNAADAPPAAYVVTPVVNPGDVGGPLVDRRGRLAGLLARADDDESALSTAIPIGRILSALAADRSLGQLIAAAPDAPGEPPGESAWPVHDRFRVVAERSRRALLGVVATPVRGAFGSPRRGTAFLVGDGGIALTNLDLLAGAESVRVVLHDGRQAAAVALGEDERRGIAVLRISIEDPPAGLELAAEVPAVGSFVAAIGAPPAEARWNGPLLTIGIVGATNRDDRRYGALHTDAAVNRANAGGPLLDLAGRVVGMISSLDGAAFNDVGVNSGVGFAIPSAAILGNLGRLAKGERIPYRPGYLGVRLSQDEREGGGVEVLSVDEGLAAEKAGLEAGDVIMRVDTHLVARLDDLRRLFVNFSEGQTIRIAVVRDGSALEVEAVLGVRPVVPAR